MSYSGWGTDSQPECHASDAGARCGQCPVRQEDHGPWLRGDRAGLVDASGVSQSPLHDPDFRPPCGPLTGKSVTIRARFSPRNGKGSTISTPLQDYRIPRGNMSHMCARMCAYACVYLYIFFCNIDRYIYNFTFTFRYLGALQRSVMEL